MVIVIDREEPFRIGWVLSQVFGVIARKGWFLLPASALFGWGLQSGMTFASRAAGFHYGAVKPLPYAVFAIGQIGFILLSALAQAITMDIVLQDRTGKRFDLAANLRHALTAAPAVMIYALARHTDVLVRLTLAMDRSLAKKPALIGGWSILIAIAGLILAVVAGVTMPAAVAEGKGVAGSLRRAVRLMRGSRWRFLFVYLVIGAITSAGAALPAWTLVQAHRPGLSPKTIYFVAGLYTNALIPLMSAALMMSYLEMRRVREGGVAGDVAQVFD